MIAEAEIQKKQEPLYEGDDGVLQTLRKMEMLALRDAKDPQIVAKAKSLTGKTDEQTIENIYAYVHQTWKYKADPAKEEHVTAPVHILNNCYRFLGCKHLDCDDFSVLLASLLGALGFKVLFRVLAWRAKSFTHVYVMVQLPKTKYWLPLDAVLKERGLFQEKDRDTHLRTLNFPVGDFMRTRSLNDNYYTDTPQYGNPFALMAGLADEKNKGGIANTGIQYDWAGAATRIVSAIGIPPNFDNAKEVLKKEAINFCETTTDGFISQRKWQLAGAGVALLIAGGGIGYWIGKK